jgi:predicted 3-demethylubiquinone-9 3-methyltransferase (glyoxalase superfamily)
VPKLKIKSEGNFFSKSAPLPRNVVSSIFLYFFFTYVLLILSLAKPNKEPPVNKNTICLWYDHDAEEAANFYAKTFPNSAVGAVFYAPSDYPGGQAKNALTVQFTVCGVSCIGLNGGNVFKHNEAFSFQIATDDQAETDRYWNAIVGNGGTESDCGWCKDKWGVSWQITPRALTDALAQGGEVAKRAFAAMMTMQKIDVATIEDAVRQAA